jgi:HD-GYP domain-containing protein (c-di-GMP phosphodiesterase class II)
MRGIQRSADGISKASWLLAAAILSVPVAAYAVLRRVPAIDPAFGSPTGHFFVVGVVAASALVLAVVVGWAARHLPDARTFALAMGFLSMAGIFLAHGAGTGPFYHQHTATPAPAATARAQHIHAAPEDDGAYGGAGYDAGYGASLPSSAVQAPAAPPDHGLVVQIARLRAVGFSARLSLMVSALCFALAVTDLRRPVADAVVRRWSALAGGAMALLAAYDVIALAFPTWLNWIPMESGVLSWSVAAVAWAGFGFAGWRFLQAYRLAALPLQGTMALSMGLLMESQWFMLRGPLWHLSWWEYHFAMLAGFLIPVIGLLRQYRTAGDLGAVVEGLFLRQSINGVRAGDPEALPALAAAVAAKDSETGEHTERVSDLAVAIGRRLGLPAERLLVLRWAGRLHDLGKIGVPNNILRKPGRLTPEEYAVMKLHSPRGGNVALRTGVLAEAAPIIRAHHERLDGSGYPDGLRGEAIPLEARIIAVADVWDALTCDRPYRAAMSHDEAASIICQESIAQLDPRCVAALFAELESRHWQAEPEQPVIGAPAPVLFIAARAA